jgi:hypothetical protein
MMCCDAGVPRCRASGILCSDLMCRIVYIASVWEPNRAKLRRMLNELSRPKKKEKAHVELQAPDI